MIGITSTNTKWSDNNQQIAATVKQKHLK